MARLTHGLRGWLCRPVGGSLVDGATFLFGTYTQKCDKLYYVKYDMAAYQQGVRL